MKKFYKKGLSKDKLNLVISFSNVLNVLQTTFKKKIIVTSSPAYNYEVKKILDKAIEKMPIDLKPQLLHLKFF